MAKFEQVDKRVQMGQWDIVKYQILTYCYLQRIAVSESDLNCLTLLALQGEIELPAFCVKVYEKEIFQSAQTARNAISKAEKKNLIVKEGKSKKKISLNPAMNIKTQGNILIDYKFLCIGQ